MQFRLTVISHPFQREVSLRMRTSSTRINWSFAPRVNIILDYTCNNDVAMANSYVYKLLPFCCHFGIRCMFNQVCTNYGLLVFLIFLQNLAAVDHSKVYYQPFRKDFYVEVPELAKLTPEGTVVSNF